MYKSVVLLFLSFICLINCSYDDYYDCRQYENKVYQLKVTFPGKKPLYAALRLQPKGSFDELFSIGGGNNAAELGVSFALSNRVGYYKCLGNNLMQLTGLGYLYKTDDVPFLKENGAVVIHDYYFRFSNRGRKINGKVKFAVFENGLNPFTTTADPKLIGDEGVVEGELLKYRKYFTLKL
ncbi:unnamed protein product [Adineta ricciae]|uniref:Lipoprotein n=1 Tax=Adineta ricciae TaxID=249248 RepID=A0A815MIL9_ADIRI|nr:unnamed protein product [Adineta ricciae]